MSRDLCVVSAKPYNVSQTGKAKPRKRKANSLGVLSSVTDWIYPGGNKKLNKDATTDPYAKKKKRKPKKRKANPRKVRSASSLSRAELKKIRINLNMRDATDAETKDAVRAYINDGGRIAELLPTRKRAKKNAPKKRKRVNAKRKTAKKRPAKKRTAPRKKTNAKKRATKKRTTKKKGTRR